MVRRLGVLVVVVMVAGVLAAGTILAQDSGVPDDAASTVRIQARRVNSGKVEFGLQLDGDRVWLPQARLFPHQTAEVGRWLFASPYTLSDGTTVRIQARRVDLGKVEFGLQLDGDRVWLPQARLFPTKPPKSDDGSSPRPTPCPTTRHRRPRRPRRKPRSTQILNSE